MHLLWGLAQLCNQFSYTGEGYKKLGFHTLNFLSSHWGQVGSDVILRENETEQWQD